MCAILALHHVGQRTCTGRWQATVGARGRLSERKSDLHSLLSDAHVLLDPAWVAA